CLTLSVCSAASTRFWGRVSSRRRGHLLPGAAAIGNLYDVSRWSRMLHHSVVHRSANRYNVAIRYLSSIRYNVRIMGLDQEGIWLHCDGLVNRSAKVESRNAGLTLSVSQASSQASCGPRRSRIAQYLSS